MIPSNPTDVQHLLDLLTRQREHYARLRELSDRQRSLISSDRPEALLGILKERQSLVAALTKLNEELAPFRRNWEAMYAALPEPARRTASNLLAEVNSLLRVILRSDLEDSEILSARKKAISDDLGGLAGGRTANAAYAQQAKPADGTARGADLKG